MGEEGPSGAEKGGRLSEIELMLRRPDFVLEPICMPTIFEYIRAGGQPQAVVELLVDGYVGE